MTTSNNPKEQEFIDRILKEIKFPLVKKEIREELTAHIEDKTREMIVEEEMSRENALLSAMEEMGDAEEIGKALNDVHRPFLGWALTVSRFLLIIFGFLTIHTLIGIGSEVFSQYTIGTGIDEERVIAEIVIDQEVTLDNRTLYFDKAVMQEPDQVIVLMESTTYTRRPRNTGVLFDQVYDDLGNSGYFDLATPYRSGLFTSQLLLSLRNVDFDAEYLVLDYDRFNRSFEIIIPLAEGSDTDE